MSLIVVKGYVWCDKEGAVHSDTLNPYGYVEDGKQDYCKPEEHHRLYRTEVDAEFAEALRLCEAIGHGRPQEIRMGASHWVYVQLSLTEARHLAAVLAEREAP